MGLSKDRYIDVSYNSLNKKGEELCGDKVEIFKSDNRTIIVLADGLGSGVKANILATLTSKIAITMLRKGADIEEVIETMAYTLPVCKIRKIAYSTFSILEIDDKGHCKIFESENPPYFFVRKGQLLELDKKTVQIVDKKVVITEVDLEIDDTLYICSDGVIHAGVGQYLNFGWQWEHVAEYVERGNEATAERLGRRLLSACDELYEGMPGDDTTVVTVKVRQPVNVFLFTGPPVDSRVDKPFISMFMRERGKKVVCGGTAANIVSRELDKEIKTQLNYEDPRIPPTASIAGIDLVTEGVLTLKRTTEMINAYADKELTLKDLGQDGAAQLFRLLVDESTYIKFWIGKALNSAHQNPDFPVELSMKTNVVNELVTALNRMGKKTSLAYVSEVGHEKI